MKTTQHTPGPWHVDHRHYPNSFTVSADPVGGIICQLDHWGKRAVDLTADLKPEGETEANARLIAAAPELLEACKALTHYLEADADDEQEREDYAQAMAAISKAEGKE